MLNISHNNISKSISIRNYKSGRAITNKKYFSYFNKFLLAAAIILIIVLFLPWTQNISGNGIVTTLKPNQRPQTALKSGL
jgi:hypothetical protein